MSSHGVGNDAVSPGGANKVIRTHEDKMGTRSSDLANEGSLKRKDDMAARADIEEEERRAWDWELKEYMGSEEVSLHLKGAMADMPDSELDNELDNENTDRWSGFVPPYLDTTRKFQFRPERHPDVEIMRKFQFGRGNSWEEICLNVYRCLFTIAVSDAQRLAITDRFGTEWSMWEEFGYSMWEEFVLKDRTLGFFSLHIRCAWEAMRLVKMINTGILSKDKWLWEYLLSFDGSAPHIVAAIYQSVFLYDLGHFCDDHPFIDESMKDMLVVGKLTIMLYREIHLHHFSGYLAGESRRLSDKFYRDILTELIKWSFSDSRGSSGMDPRTSSNMVEWLIRSIKESVDDVRARARAQPGYIPDQNKLPSSDEVWNRAKSLKERLHDLKLCAADNNDENELVRLKQRLHDLELCATDNNDENVLARNMPISILCSAAAQELDLSICQRLYNKHFVLSKLGASNYLELDNINELGGLVCVIEAVKVETGVKVCSCIIKDNLVGFLICMNVGYDEVDTKRRIFVEEAFRYVGTLQVTVTKERTTIESLQDDGRYFQGDFQDFSFGKQKASCAAKALSGLPGSEYLQQSGLQCTALHMIALAICAGAEGSIQLQWNGERGHIHCNEVERYIDHSSKEGGFEVPYSECCMLYTEEGRELARDVLWGMESLNRQYIPQLASTIRNPSTGLILRGPSTSDVGIQVSTEAPTSTETWREAATRIPCPPEAIGEDRDDTAIAATPVSDRDERLLREALTNRDERIVELLTEGLRSLMYPSEGPTIEKVKLDETAIAAVLLANKKNFSAAVSIMGSGLQGSWECRPSEVDRLLKEYITKQLRASAFERLTLVPHESWDVVHSHVESKFLNGSLKEDKEEYLLIQNDVDNTCVQVFLLEHSTEKLIFLTDIAVGDGKRVTEALENLKGSWLEGKRFGSDIYVYVPGRLQHNLRYARKILPFGQDVLKKMGNGPESFPLSEDQWKHIIGDRRDHEGSGRYWNATEMEAVICAATRFTTGNAVERTLTHVGSELRGGCTSSNVREHRISFPKVCATGRFSNFKGSGLRKIYWG